MSFGTAAVPAPLQWWGLGREGALTGASGTVTAPSISIPLEKGQPSDKVTMLVDKNVRGMMGTDYADVQGVEIGDFPLSGDVYLDSIGHLLFNIFGDYIATGSNAASSTTLNGAANAGQNQATLTSASGYSNGNAVQIGVTGDGNPEIAVITNISTNTLTFATNLRYTHASGRAVSVVTAPFSHTFSLLNSGTGQPPTHTITYHNQLTTTYFARQYAYWCASGMDFKLNSEQMFMHDTKGTSIAGQAATSTPTNTQTGLAGVADWEWKVGIGGPASGGTQVNTPEDATINIARELKPKFTLQNSQAPFVIARLGLGITGKMTFVAQDESPLLALLANTQQQLQFTLTQGASSTLESCTFNFQNVAYEVADIQAPDVLTWEVNWRALMNSTDAGQSGGMSPGHVIIQNAIPTY